MSKILEVLDSLGTLALNAAALKEKSALERERMNQQVHLKKMDHLNRIDQIETTNKLNALSQEVVNATNKMNNNLKALNAWNVTINDQSKLKDLDVSPDFSSFADKLKDDTQNSLTLSVEDFKEGVSQYDRQRFKLQHLNSINNSLALLRQRGNKAIVQASKVKRDAGDDYLDSVKDASDFVATAKQEGLIPGDFDWKVFMSQAPTEKDVFEQVRILNELKDLDSSGGSAGSSKVTNDIDVTLRSNINAFNGIDKSLLSDNYKKMLLKGDMKGMKPDAKFFESTENIETWKKHLTTNIQNVLDKGQVSLTNIDQSSLMSNIQSGDNEKIRQAINSMLGNDTGKKDIYGYSKDIDLDILPWGIGGGSQQDKAHFAEQLKFWINLDNKQKMLQGNVIPNPTGMPKGKVSDFLKQKPDFQWLIKPTSGRNY